MICIVDVAVIRLNVCQYLNKCGFLSVEVVCVCLLFTINIKHGYLISNKIKAIMSNSSMVLRSIFFGVVILMVLKCGGWVWCVFLSVA